MALFYEAWNSGKRKWERFTFFKGSKPALAGANIRLNSERFIKRSSEVSHGARIKVSSAFENLFPQFYEYLFTSSNITISYEAYSCTITNKSFLSLSLSTLDKHPDRCELKEDQNNCQFH
ncbi:LOW QUALITY PROTEIN: hypothetical protein V1477_001445 [Vespula maculifrons]|uniref:Uncharacterized protein n=1 Tax=Vespula maculifrons TaxID=7453 RepID=A0ABD2D073_VESMC